MNAHTLFVISWWFRHRLKYNNALLFTGLIGFLFQAVLHPFKYLDREISISLLQNIEISGTFFGIFLLLANIAFTAGSVLDLLFNHQDSSSFRTYLFLGGYWFAITVLIVMIFAFLSII